jgi:hypothetical protein
MRRFIEELSLSGLILLCAAVSPNIFPVAQAGYANMETLALWGLIPSLVVMAITLAVAVWRGHRRLVNRVWVGIAAGMLTTIGLEAVRITSFRVFSGMPGDLPQLLGVLLLNRFALGPSLWSDVVGYLYHFWNGACFDIIFAVIFGRIRFYWGMLYGEAIGNGFLLSPAVTALGVGFFASNMHSMQITVWVAHLFYGVILGLLCQRWIHERGWLLSRRANVATPRADGEAKSGA